MTARADDHTNEELIAFASDLLRRNQDRIEDMDGAAAALISAMRLGAGHDQIERLVRELAGLPEPLASLLD